MSAAKICFPCFPSKGKLTPKATNTIEDGLSLNPEINTPMQEACTNLSNRTWVKIEENYHRHENVEMTPIATLAHTRNSEFLSFSVTKSNYSDSNYMKYNKMPSMVMQADISKLKTVTAEVHLEPREKPFIQNLIKLNKRNCETLI